MHRIVMPDLVRLLARVGARRLGDQDVPVALAEAARETGTSMRRGALRAGADASAAVALHVFNATGDRDDGGVLGTRRRASGAEAADAHRPLLLKQAGQAWLRISLAADADALARGSRGALSVRAGADGEARLLCYRRHAPDARCADAIAMDLPRFASALSVDDACALGVGDACVVQSEGRLTASATLAWDGLLAEAIPGMAGLVGGDAPAYLVEVAAGASASLALSATDGFSVAIARQHASGDRAFRVAVRRHRLGEREATATLGVEAGFEDPDAAAAVTAGALADLLGAPATALRAVREATSLRAVPTRHRPVVAALVERFGIQDTEPVPALRERLSELDARLMGRLRELARSRAALEFEAAYRRLSSDAVLLECELSEAALRRLHPALLALDVPAVLGAAAQAGGEATLLHDRRLQRDRTWGVGVSFGRWFELESGQRREDHFLERRRVDADGTRLRREYLGTTRYAARANGWSTNYGARFESVDADDGRGAGCALQLWWEEGRMRADRNGIARIVDDAVLWGVVDATAAPALDARLHAALDGVGRCRPRFEHVLEGEAAIDALDLLAAARDHQWAGHLARALPRNARVTARRDCATRAAVYGPVFASLGDDAAGALLRRRIASSLRPGDARLAAREGDGEAPWTAWRVLQQSGLARHGLAHAWRGWSTAAADLRRHAEGVRTGAEPRTTNEGLAGAFARLRPAFEQPFTLRTVASLLASGTGGARMALAFERDGEPRTLLAGTQGRGA